MRHLVVMLCIGGTALVSACGDQNTADVDRAMDGVNVIDGGCPLMFGPTADFGHKCMKAVLTLTRNVPRQV